MDVCGVDNGPHAVSDAVRHRGRELVDDERAGPVRRHAPELALTLAAPYRHADERQRGPQLLREAASQHDGLGLGKR
jgi:hypothetical protein